MFLVGQTSSVVMNRKLQLPKEYHLKRKRLLYKWKNQKLMILSDVEGSLNYHAGKAGAIKEIYTDQESRIEVPKEYEGRQAWITGNISAIEIRFE